MRRILLFVLLALASLAFARPARAQFTYGEIPWGSDLRATTRGLAAQGFTLDEEFRVDEGEILYVDQDGVLAFATFAGDRLVGLRFAYTGTADEVEDLYAQSVQGGRENLGEPQSEEDDMVGWESEGTWFTVMLGQTEQGLPYTAVQYTGPGYAEEMTRRTGRTAAGFPVLEERWVIVQESAEFRTAVDRTTILAQGGRVFRAWAREDYAVTQTDPFEYNQVSFQMDYDCAQRRIHVITATYRLAGERVQTDTASADRGWVPLEPDTAEERMLLTVCELGQRR